MNMKRVLQNNRRYQSHKKSKRKYRTQPRKNKFSWYFQSNSEKPWLRFLNQLQRLKAHWESFQTRLRCLFWHSVISSRTNFLADILIFLKTKSKISFSQIETKTGKKRREEIGKLRKSVRYLWLIITQWS